MSKASDIINATNKLKHEEEIRILRAQLKSERAMKAVCIDEKERLESQLDAMQMLKAVKSKRSIQNGKKSGRRAASVVLPCCDWHAGEVIRHESVNGINSYDIAECERRVHRYFQKAVELIRWYSELSPVKELWLPLLGDLVSGDIHAELRESNEASASEAVLLVQDLLHAGITYLRNATKLPIIIPTVPGNHGRSTDKIRIKTDTRNSWEQMLYRSLARYYNSNPGVDVRVGEALLNEQEIAGRYVRFLHGHVIRYYGGVGGISVPVNKAVQAWNDIKSADFTIFGHYHAFQWYYPRWVSCGCIVGASEYSVWIRAPWQHPSQTFISIDPEYGMTCAMPIFVKQPKRVQK